jgi:hypothetical protein
MDDNPSWHIVGDWFDNCSCAVPCPCTFAQAPDSGYCESVLFWHVREGHYGDVNLDNLSFVRVGRWEGDLWARLAPPHRHREGRRRVERGVEPLGRESGRHGRSRRPRLTRHGLRRDREHRRQRGPARGRCRIPDVNGDLRSCCVVTLPGVCKSRRRADLAARSRNRAGQLYIFGSKDTSDADRREAG